MRAVVRTGGELIELNCQDRFLSGVLAEGLVAQFTDGDASRPDIRVTVENTVAAFDTHGWDVLTRDAWRRPGQVLVQNACSSGLDLLITTGSPTLEILARWRPLPAVRAASFVLRSRSRLLIRAVLLQYPVLWWGQQRGRSPLHASVCSVGKDHARSVLIAGPGGVGKSTMINAELEQGAVATSDNLCLSDGRTAWGLLEPRRVPAGESENTHGRRMPHDRREAPWRGRVHELVPEMVLVLQRGTTKTSMSAACDPDEAARSLVAGTYMAGELRRYWAFASTLALGTGVGDIHPQVDQVARKLTASLPCREVTLGQRPVPTLERLLAPKLTDNGVDR
jgi:hypothetical protein